MSPTAPLSLLYWQFSMSQEFLQGKDLHKIRNLPIDWQKGGQLVVFLKVSLLPSDSAPGSPGGLAHLAWAQPLAYQSVQAVSEQGLRFPAWHGKAF